MLLSFCLRDPGRSPTAQSRDSLALLGTELLTPCKPRLSCNLAASGGIQFLGSSRATEFVTEDSRVLGAVNLTSLQRDFGAGDPTLRDLVNDINFPHVHTDQSLDLALERMGANHLQVLPVVSRADVHNLLGIVTLSDVLDSYGLGIPDSDVS